MQGACRVRARYVLVLCGRGHRQKPGDGCAMSHQEISIVRQKKDSSVGGRVRAVREGAVRAVRCCEASVKARYLHGVSARHRSWYESGSSSASKGAGQVGAVQGRGALGGDDFWGRAAVPSAPVHAGDDAVPMPRAHLQR